MSPTNNMDAQLADARNRDHYRDYTIGDLRKLIEARNLKPRTKPKVKNDHVNVLAQSDASHRNTISGSFMDLPPELRNTIYQDVIDHEKGMKRWKKALLCVSKQVSAETKGIYKHNLAAEKKIRRAAKKAKGASIAWVRRRNFVKRKC